MTNKWFTIIFSNPSANISAERLNKINKNCAGQYVLFDGITTYNEATKATSDFAPHCKEISLFLGKDCGKLVSRYVDGVYKSN